MLNTEFPLVGPLSEISLILEWSLSIFFLEMGMYFLIRSIRKKNLKNIQERAYIFLFSGYFLMWVFIIIADYYVTDNSIRIILLNIGFSLEILSVFLFIVFMESIKNFLGKYLFSISSAGLIAIYVSVLIFYPLYASFISNLFWVIFLIFFIFYLKEIYTDFYIIRKFGNIKYKFIQLCLGVIFVVVGYQLTTRFITLLFGIHLRLIGDILQILGLILLTLFYNSVPSFSEYDWQDKINTLILAHHSGLLLYSTTFNETEEINEYSLLSGAFSSLEMMLEETFQEKQLSVIERDDKIIIIFSGNYTYGILITNENLKSLHILLKRFVEKVEIIYAKILENWNGDLRILNSIRYIKDDIFFPKTENS